MLKGVVLLNIFVETDCTFFQDFLMNVSFYHFNGLVHPKNKSVISYSNSTHLTHSGL